MAGMSLRLILGVMAAGLTSLSPMGASADSAKESADVQRTVMELVADVSAGPSRRIAVGMSLLANLRPDIADINIDWIVQNRSIESLLEPSSDLALLDLAKVDLAAIEDQTDLRAVMTFWHADEADDGQGDAHPGYLLLAQSTVSPGFIHGFLDAVQDDVETLETAQVDTGKLDLSTAMAASPIALHESAGSYLALSNGASPVVADKAPEPVVPISTTDVSLSSETSAERVVEPAQTPIPGTETVSVAENVGRSFTLYFSNDEAKLDRDDFKLVAEACQYASTLPSARFVISGHTDTVGSDAYNARLAERRALATAEAIKNDPRFREALSVIEHGETMQAVLTDDNVPEPKNRRVEITIIEGS